MTIRASDVVTILAKHIDSDQEGFYHGSDYWHYGGLGYTERVAAIAELAAQHYPGDLAEIGCARGLTTTRLAEVAQSHGRRVIAVDPWDVADPSCDEGAYEEFLENTKSHTEIMDVLRLESQDKQAIQRLKSRDLCFAFVDGLHTYKACLSDIRAVSHAPVIAVDDILWDWALLRAFHEGAGERTRIRHPFCREGYIL